MTWLQRDPGGEQWRSIQHRTESAVAAGLPLWLQASARGIGVILGLDTTFHPFIGFPGYLEIAHLPLRERAAALRDPLRKARILGERSGRLSGDGSSVPPLVDLMLARIELVSARMFPLLSEDGSSPEYAPRAHRSFGAQAQHRGVSALEALYDYLSAGEGDQLIHFPIFNYNDGSLEVVRNMLTHPRALYGLSDAGAHVGTICDASTTTFMLTHWGQVAGSPSDGSEPLSPVRLVEMLSARNARHLGLADRGRIAIGCRADLNLIDPSRLAIGDTRVVRDLPAGGKRLQQDAFGYLGTWVAGTRVAEQGRATAARPGRLVRLR
jgi:N-acyl-D-aspartate/D-glutamate deacylase